MTKSELVERLTLRIGIHPHAKVRLCVEHILEQMTLSLARGERIEFRDFGSFSVKHYEPRKGRNPKSGKDVMCKARVRPKFKSGLKLRRGLNP
jgi:integration host factor subunit beta